MLFYYNSTKVNQQQKLVFQLTKMYFLKTVERLKKKKSLYLLYLNKLLRINQFFTNLEKLKPNTHTLQILTEIIETKSILKSN